MHACLVRVSAWTSPPIRIERSLFETVKHYVEMIFYIRHKAGRVRPGRLAEWRGLSAPTVTVTLQRMARDGVVRIGADRSVSRRVSRSKSRTGWMTRSGIPLPVRTST